MVALIVLSACGFGALTTYFKTRHRVDERVLERIERLEELVGDNVLEERVRTLEVIITDEKRRLDSELQRL